MEVIFEFSTNITSEMTLNYAYYLLLQYLEVLLQLLVGEYYSLLDWYYCSLVIKEATI